MLKIGDRVKIVNNGGKPTYDKALGKQGTITQVRTYDRYDTIYYVELDCGLINENNDMNSWCCTEKMLQPYKEMVVVRTRWTADDLQGYDVTKKENEMKILEIYYDRKLSNINVECMKEQRKIKMKDEKYNKLLRIETELSELTGDVHIFTHNFEFSKEIQTLLSKCDNKHKRKRDDLTRFIKEVEAQLSMCETYEQKQNVLRNYEIIDEKGMVNA